MADRAAVLGTEGSLGPEMYRLAARLFPIARSITGDGVRKTLQVIGELVPVSVVEVPSGTRVLDWTIPPEWNIRDAWIADASGERVVDFRRSNLHIVGYSVPIRARMSLAELRPHLHTLPARPDVIPYRTSYYAPSWGFCLTQRALDALTEGEYEVCIDATLAPGHLTYGEVVLPGESTDEILISTHVCHPSLANDNVSGIVVASFLARHFARVRRRLTLRFLFAPGTIGALTWLACNREHLGQVRHGLTLASLGDAHPFTYKRTVSGTAAIDVVVPHSLASSGHAYEVADFVPYGYDERQYNAPGFRLPIGSLTRAREGGFPEYHTSADDLSFIQPERLAESLDAVASIIALLDSDRRYRNLAPHGEPQLARRGLYKAIGGSAIGDLEFAMLWVLCLSDGGHGVLDIALRAGLEPAAIQAAADALVQHGLLAPI